MSAARNRETVKTACGVRLSPDHILSKSVHSFHRWTGETTLLTWCAIPVELSDGGRQTKDLVSCLACGQASWDAYWGRR